MRWQATNRNRSLSEKRNKSWLALNFALPNLAERRPTMVPEVEQLVENVNTRELRHATGSKMYRAGLVVDEQTDKSPGHVVKIRKRILGDGSVAEERILRYSGEGALAIKLDSHLSRCSYMKLRSGAKALHSNIYPSYQKVLTAKKKCYPEGLRVYDDESGEEKSLA
jgi:hypothetical protein